MISPINLKEGVKSVFYTLGSFDISQYLVSKWKGNSVILCYHRVLPDQKFRDRSHPASNLITSQKTFDSHMKFLSENYSLGDISQIDLLSGPHLFDLEFI